MARQGGMILVLLLAGCAMSLQDLRQQPPAQTRTIPDRRYDVLVGCVAEGLQVGESDSFLKPSPSHFMYQVNQRPDQRRATITGYQPDGPGFKPWALIDLTFVQNDGAVVVESRLGDFAGGEGGVRLSRQLNEAAWRIIERCAGAPPSASSG
jgi:hypothetical protein